MKKGLAFFILLISQLMPFGNVHAACPSSLPSGMLFCDDFETSSVSNYDGGWRDYISYITDSNVMDGSRSIRATVTPGINSAASIYKFFEPQDGDVYARWYAKFDINYYDQGGMHFGTLQALDRSKPCGCSGCCANTRPLGDDRYLSALEFSDGGDGVMTLSSRIYSYFYNQRNPSSSYACCPKPLSTWARAYSPQPANNIQKGVWYEMEIMLHPNTPGRDDGYQKYWVNGKLIMDIQHATPACGPYTSEPYSTICETDDPTVDAYPNFYTNPPPYPIQYPAEGFMWRTTSNLKINNIWLQLYNHYALTANPTTGRTNPRPNLVWFDDLAVSQNYIGPLRCYDGQQIEFPCYCEGAPSPANDSNVYSSGFCCSDSWQPEACSSDDIVSPDNPTGLYIG